MTKAIVKNTAGQATLLVFKKRNRTKGMIVANSSTKTKNFKIRQTNIQLLLLLRNTTNKHPAVTVATEEKSARHIKRNPVFFQIRSYKKGEAQKTSTSHAGSLLGFIRLISKASIYL